MAFDTPWAYGYKTVGRLKTEDQFVVIQSVTLEEYEVLHECS